ncbi:MAG: LemA family protein [Proteobacteria bacterium]|nr:LemA family protein [Pseudomonadota bacterium]
MQNWIIWATLGAAAVFFIVLYNRIISLVQARKNAFSDIDVQLKLRHDLIPNLIETVKGYAAHEKGVLENVTAARASAMRGGSISDRVQSESALSAAMMQLMAVAENYPQLKADANFRQLQSELSDIENKIAAARRFFNNATNEYNTGIQQFPSVLVARLFGYKEEVFFELGAEAQAAQTPPKVSF